ncbi:hypothetical protein RA210_U10390 [Rubrivivax sp. A210]|nr:hypothetical protein RA210_U10390 [Rubrivivax sp. A210]
MSQTSGPGLTDPRTASTTLPASGPSPAALPTDSDVLSRQLWRHRFGEMLIETRNDGTVWIDGKVVPDTLPSGLADSGRPAP